MNVVVTGASGHVGANLVWILVARGDRVRVLIHEETEALQGVKVVLKILICPMRVSLP